MTLRDCEGLYKCGNGTEESCRRSLCPFYKAREERKPKPKPGHYELDEFSGLWIWVEDRGEDDARD